MIRSRSCTSQLKDKCILVTGGAGFLGRHVCAQLQTYRPDAIVAPRRSEFDLRKQEEIIALLQEVRPDVVVHLATVGGELGTIRRNPGRFFYDNLMMGTQLMEHARRARVQKFVSVGSACSYPKLTPIPFREEDIWNGYPDETDAAYGLAKKMLMVQGQAYREQYGFNAISLVPVNLYGPGDNFDPANGQIIPALIRKLVQAVDHEDREIVAWGSGQATREFLFVSEAARAIALATERYDQAQPINVGSGHEIRIKDLADLIGELCGFRGVIHWDDSPSGSQSRRCLDTSRARRELGFRANVPLRAGLVETITWYRHQLTEANPHGTIDSHYARFAK